MKSFFRFVLLALVLLVVALVSALTAMRFAIHGREVAVPDLVGKTPAEARRIADSGGFQMDIETPVLQRHGSRRENPFTTPRSRNAGAPGLADTSRRKVWVRSGWKFPTCSEKASAPLRSTYAAVDWT